MKNKWIQVGKIEVGNATQINEMIKEIESIEKFTTDLGEVLDNSKNKP